MIRIILCSEISTKHFVFIYFLVLTYTAHLTLSSLFQIDYETDEGQWKCKVEYELHDDPSIVRSLSRSLSLDIPGSGQCCIFFKYVDKSQETLVKFLKHLGSILKLKAYRSGVTYRDWPEGLGKYFVS